MAADSEFLAKRDYKPAELAETIHEIKKYISGAASLDLIKFYDDDTEILALKLRTSMSDEKITIPVQLVPTVITSEFTVDGNIDDSVDLLGKTAHDLQYSLRVDGDTIRATSRSVSSYVQFSSDTTLQSGYFIALHIDGAAPFTVVPSMHSSATDSYAEMPHAQVGDYIVINIGSGALTDLKMDILYQTRTIWSSVFSMRGIARQSALNTW